MTADPVAESLEAGHRTPPEIPARRSLPGIGSFVLIRLGFMLLTALAVLRVPESGIGLTEFHAWDRISSLFFGTFEHWDADQFLEIAKGGYDAHLAAFMPVYPGLVHVGGWITRSDLVAAVLISLAAAAAGVWAVKAIAERLTTAEIGSDSVLLYALYPISFVFTAPYSEGLFLAASAGSVLFAMRNRLWIAGLLAAVAIDARILGLALVPALLIIAWPLARRTGALTLIPIVALPLAALVAVAAYFDHALGDSLAFLHAQKDWGRHVGSLGPLDAMWRSAQATYHGIGTLIRVPTDFETAQVTNTNVLDFVLLVAAIALTVVVFRRLGTALGVYSTGLILIATSAPVTDGGEILQSMPRFMLVDFPLFIAGASLLRDAPAKRGPVFGCLIAVGAVACIAFSRKIWVA